MAQLPNRGYLASMFSPPFIRRLGEQSGRNALQEVIATARLEKLAIRSRTVGDFFDGIYALLRSQYRCEYVYKNAIASQELIAKYAPGKAFLHSELQVGNSKADVVLVNGTSQVYEIKTELDSLDRLRGQLDAYLSAFDEVYIVTHERCALDVTDIAPQTVGILVLDTRGNLGRLRSAGPNSSRILPETVFDIMRKSEYLEVLRRLGVVVPAVPNTMVYQICRELFVQLPKEVVHAEFVRVLADRGRSRTNAITGLVPHSLRFHSLIGNLGAAQRRLLSEAIDSLLN